jgi:DNA polymerase III subunit delta'
MSFQMSRVIPIGHEESRSRLHDAAVRNRLAHALLFTGPAGIGKSLVAIELAARLLCDRAGTAPCGECGPCVQVRAGTHPDFVRVALLSGKKEISVDAVRQLKRAMQMRAISGTRRIGVIDDADRLSLAAQNALLKTLEEPPHGALLILITASVPALLPTVRSRCQLHVFQPLSAAQVATVLSSMPEIGSGEADALAAQAQGSPGYALSLRALSTSEDAQALSQLLADLDPDRYGSVLRLARALGRTEQEMVPRLQQLQLSYHARALTALSNGGPLSEAERASRGAAVVGGIIDTLQRRNPNRPLLAEAIALQLARS